MRSTFESCDGPLDKRELAKQHPGLAENGVDYTSVEITAASISKDYLTEVVGDLVTRLNIEGTDDDFVDDLVRRMKEETLPPYLGRIASRLADSN